MINPGERVAVGISGGKDSLALLYILKEIQRYYPNKFDLCGITVDMGFKDSDFSNIQSFCDSLGVPYYIKRTNIGEVVFDIRHEPNPCALCARLRRGALHDAALENGFNTIALGHHLDDAVETYLMSLIFEGRINCFRPKTFLDRKGVTVIRPLLYIEEAKIAAFAQANRLPVFRNPCPADGETKRAEIKKMVAELEAQYHGVKGRIFGAIKRYPLKGWE